MAWLLFLKLTIKQEGMEQWVTEDSKLNEERPRVWEEGENGRKGTLGNRGDKEGGEERGGDGRGGGERRV